MILTKPTVVCLCGSTRFSEAFRKANLEETLAGRIVLTIGCDTKSDDALGLPPETEAKLDELHLRKIDMADEVLILNVDGYIGESTRKELAYAAAHGKRVRFLDEGRMNVFVCIDEHKATVHFPLGGAGYAWGVEEVALPTPPKTSASPQVSEGVKADAEKPRWSLLPPGSVEVVVRVLEYGARKYSVDNWRHVPDARRRYYDAAMRHLTAWWGGEANDPESRESHLGHVGCCVLFLLWFELTEEKS